MLAAPDMHRSQKCRHNMLSSLVERPESAWPQRATLLELGCASPLPAGTRRSWTRRRSTARRRAHDRAGRARTPRALRSGLRRDGNGRSPGPGARAATRAWARSRRCRWRSIRAPFEEKMFLHMACSPGGAAGSPPTGKHHADLGGIGTSGDARDRGLAAANAAIEALVPILAAELRPMRVNAVSPGVIDTAWWDFLPAEPEGSCLRRSSPASTPVGRIGTADDVAMAIAFLVRNSFMSGHVLDLRRRCAARSGIGRFKHSLRELVSRTVSPLWWRHDGRSDDATACTTRSRMPGARRPCADHHPRASPAILLSQDRAALSPPQVGRGAIGACLMGNSRRCSRLRLC